MGDKETRKRKKRRESAKKEETDDSSPPRETPQDISNKKKDDTSSSHSLNEPSILAKLVFCVLFVLLIGAVGLIFYTLNEAQRESSEILDGDDHGEKSEALPIIDDHDLDEEADSGGHGDEDDEEHDGDTNIEPNIEEIINSIEESVTYDIDGQEPTNREVLIDSLNNEDAPDDAQDSSNDEVSVLNENEAPKTISNSDDILLYNTDEIRSEVPENTLSLDDSTLQYEEKNIPLETVSTPDWDELRGANDNPEETSFNDSEDDDDFDELGDESEGKVERGDITIEQPEAQKEEIQPSSVADEKEGSELNEEGVQKSEEPNKINPSEDIEPEPKSYEHEDITNDFDFLFREELDEADKLVEKSLENAQERFDSLLVQYPKSPRATYSKARILDKLAEQRRSNTFLQQSIELYKKTMAQPKVPEKLYLLAGNRAVDRLRFRGMVGKALALQSEMADKYPNNIHTQNQLAVSYMWMGKNNEAKEILQEVLKKDPSSGLAKVHLGFIIKNTDQNYKEAIDLLSEGIASGEEGVIDGRFYFHLGDALQRMGLPDKALKVYEEGVKKGIFLSALQRSLYNVDGLTGRPWWTPKETSYVKDIKILENNWLTIRNEALALLSVTRKGFEPEGEGLKDTGDWQQFNLFMRGQKLVENCQKAPRTCELVESIPKAAKCKRGQVKFSIMQPGTHVWAHTGPTNCRLRAHLGLVVPNGPLIRVGNETREWKEGKVIIFDDSFEHEVWHKGNSQRIVLIIDFWHPELSDNVIQTLTPI